MEKDTLRMQFLSGVITESEYKAIINKEIEDAEKDSLNESMIGGIVGIGAINQIPPRAKADYETAFEHFLGEKYGLNEVEEMEEPLDPIVKEGDENIILRAYEIAEEIIKNQLEFPDDAIENKDLYLEVIKALKDILYGKAADIFDKRAGSAPDEYSSDRTISNQNLNKSAYIDGRIEYTSEESN